MQFITDNILALSVMLLSGTMLLWSFFGNRVRGIQTVDCIAAMQMINHKDALVLDVRPDAEYRKGYVLGSRNLPLAEFKNRLTQFEKFKKKPVILVCQNGSRAGDACVMLGKQGFEQVFALTGGLGAWQKASLPLEKK